MVFILRSIKGVTYYLRHWEKKRGKSLSIKKYSREKLVFVFSEDLFKKKKKIQFIIVDFQTQFDFQLSLFIIV